MIEKSLALRLASCVYDLVENGGVYGTDLEISYEDACSAIGLDDFETEAVLAIIDEDIRLV